MAAIIVGIISDIHGVLSKNATKELASCDVILCAGDVEREFILMELDAIAPTIAVKGNCDYPSISSDVPFTASPRIGGVRFFMVHREAVAAYSGDEAGLFEVAATAAKQGAENSKNFVSKFGRAKSYGEKTIGTPDAGAVSMACFFKGLAQA